MIPNVRCDSDIDNGRGFQTDADDSSLNGVYPVVVLDDGTNSRLPDLRTVPVTAVRVYHPEP